jgi:hypothetical protein
MDVSDIGFQRLAPQRISHPPFTKPDEVVSWLCGLQGQDYEGAKWSIGLRLPGSTQASIEQAITEKSVRRGWFMRGTLHLVAAADVHWLLALLAPRLIAGSARRYRELELDAPTMVRSNDILAKALRDGTQQRRTELLALLEENGISTEGQRAAYLLQRASLDGLICQGNAERNNPLYMALDEAPAHVKTLAREEALAELAKRYFVSRGPATFQDFVAWSDLITSEARAGLEAVKPQLIETTLNGQTYWMADAPLTKPDHAAYLLPGFDEYVLGYRDRSAVLEQQYANKIVPGGNGIFYPTIVINGRVVGTWKRTIKKQQMIITPAPFTALTESDQNAFEDAARRYGEYMELPVVIA